MSTRLHATLDPTARLILEHRHHFERSIDRLIRQPEERGARLTAVASHPGGHRLESRHTGVAQTAKEDRGPLLQRPVCASPAYLAERGMPLSPSDLTQHICLSYRRPRNGQIRDWRFTKGKRRETITPTARLIFNSGEALIAAAGSGLGLVQVAEYYAQPGLDSGSLVEVLRGHRSHAYDISVVFQRGKRIAPRLRAMVDFLVELFDPPPWKGPAAH